MVLGRVGLRCEGRRLLDFDLLTSYPPARFVEEEVEVEVEAFHAWHCIAVDYGHWVGS